MHHVFISYSRRTSEAVERLIAVLAKHDLPIWIDRRDIPLSIPWLEVVEDAIRASDLIVFCESSHFFDSEVCLQERSIAEVHGKATVGIDAEADAPIGKAAEAIVAAYRSLTDVDRLHTELLVQSAAWDKHGRRGSALARSRRLRMFRRMAASSARPLTTTAREYLRASSRRQARRRTFAGIGLLVVPAALGITQELNKTQKRFGKQTADAIADLIIATGAEKQLSFDVYGSLRNTSNLVLSGRRSYTTMLELTRALDVPVPDRSYVLPRRAIGFASGVVTGLPTVVDNEGGRWTPAGSTVTDRALSGHVSAAAASDDGKIIAYLSARSLRGDLSGRSVRPGCPSGLSLVAVASDGSLAAGGGASQVCSWNTGLGTVKSIDLPGGVTETALAVTAREALVGTDDGRVIVVDDGVAAELPAAAGPGAVTGLAASRDGRFAAVAHAGEGALTVVSLPSGRLYRRVSLARPAGPLAFSSDGRVVAAAVGQDVEIIDIASGSLRTTLRGSTGGVRQIAWSRDSSRVWVVAGQQRVTSWHWRSGRVIVNDRRRWFVSAPPPTVSGLTAVASRDGAITVVDGTRGRVSARIQTSARPALNGTMDAAGQRAVVSAQDAVGLVDLPTGRVQVVPVPDCLAISAGFTRDGKTLYVACAGGPLLVVDPADGRVERSAYIPGGGAMSVAVASGTGELFVGSARGFILTLDPTRLEPVVLHTSNGQSLYAIAAASDGNAVVAAGDGVGKAGTTYTGYRSASGHWEWDAMFFPGVTAEQVRAIALSPDRQLVAYGFSDGTVQMFRATDLNPGPTWTEMLGAIRGLSFTRDSTHLVAATRDGIVEALPVCSSCSSPSSLVQRARQRLVAARRFGLTK